MSSKRQLVSLEAKQNIGKVLSVGKNVILNASAARILPKTIYNQVVVFQKDGRIRTLHRKKNAAQDPRKIARFMGLNYLDSLGILQANNKKVKRYLALASMASGFLAGVRKDYLEGYALGFESCEFRDISKMELFEKMTYFVPCLGFR